MLRPTFPVNVLLGVATVTAGVLLPIPARKVADSAHTSLKLNCFLDDVSISYDKYLVTKSSDGQSIMALDISDVHYFLVKVCVTSLDDVTPQRDVILLPWLIFTKKTVRLHAPSVVHGAEVFWTPNV